MPGTKIGGQKAAITNKKKHGEDFYKNIGRKGGRNGHTGGFASNPELAKAAGRKGGKISRRRPKEVLEKERQQKLKDLVADFDKYKAYFDKYKAYFAYEDALQQIKDEELEEDRKFIKKISW